MELPKYEQYPDVESVNNYRPGGFHPIQLGDTFRDGRYTIVHKLGYGTYSTVWLARTSVEDGGFRYVSLKVLVASAAEWSGNSSQESEVLELLRMSKEDEPGKEHIMEVLDIFEHQGPNGVHRCIVTELLGPSLTSDIEDLYPTEIFPAPLAKRFIRQVVRGVQYLHSKNIIHGDLHAGNILLVSPKLRSLSSQSDIDEVFGEPINGPLRLRATTSPLSPTILPPNVPPYVVPVPATDPLLHLCLDDPVDTSVKICDFSESCIVGKDTPRIANMPRIYRAPEIMLGKPSIPSKSTDIWALAVFIYFHLTGGASLFHSPYAQQDELLRSMVLFFKRPLPEPVWSEWEARSKYFDNEGNWISAEPVPWPGGRMVRIRESIMQSEDEWRLLAEMLARMVELDPTRRATIEEVISSKWFTTY